MDDVLFVTDQLSLEELLKTADLDTGCIYSVSELSEAEAKEFLTGDRHVPSRIQDHEMASRVSAVTGAKIEANPGFNPPLLEGQGYLLVQDGSDGTESGLSWYMVFFMLRESNVDSEEDCEECSAKAVCPTYQTIAKSEIEA